MKLNCFWLKTFILTASSVCSFPAKCSHYENRFIQKQTLLEWTQCQYNPPTLRVYVPVDHCCLSHYCPNHYCSSFFWYPLGPIPILNIGSMHPKLSIFFLLSQQKNTYGSVTASPNEFPELRLRSVSTQNKTATAVCGISYMQYAFDSVLEHQKTLLVDGTPLITSLTGTHQWVKLVETCLSHVLDTHCGTFNKNPAFPSDQDHYKRKQWGLAALKHSLHFLQELLEFLLEAKFARLKP